MNTPTMLQIASEVAARHGLTIPDLRSRSLNRRHILPAKQEAMALSYETGKSNRQVSSFYGGRDHTAAIRARKAYAKRLAVGIAAE